MNLLSKTTLFFGALGGLLIAVLVAISLYSFREFSLTSATEHVRTASEIVRVHLTESMINGVIDRRESFLQRLMEVEGLLSARVVRGPLVEAQFGKGLNRELPMDALEMSVLRDGKARYEVEETEKTVFRGTIPFIATAHGTPNCLQCHHVKEGQVLGAVTMTVSIDHLKNKAILTIAGIVATVAGFGIVALVFLWNLIRPVSRTAGNVERAVQQALKGDFKAQLRKETEDEIGQIADELNQLFGYLDNRLSRIGRRAADLIQHTPSPDENLLTATIDMVEGLTRAAQFKQIIEEDESRQDVYYRIGATLGVQFGISEYSIYEVSGKKQMMPRLIDGEVVSGCRWCNADILARPDTCRVTRTGRMVDGISSPGICTAFAPPDEHKDKTHYCLPIIQSGAVGSVVQLVFAKEESARVAKAVPYFNACLREAAPVLETRRLMESLREATLRDPLTGLGNRRFLEEFVDTLVATVKRRKTKISVMMLDLDYFKMVNDTHGHDAGDAVLKVVARILREAVRSSDLVIRFGGEEFLIILQDAVVEDAGRIAESIRSTIAETKITVGDVILQKTISIGISCFPDDSETFWQAVKFADIALYQAKERGRNRVVHFDQTMWSNNDNNEY